MLGSPFFYEDFLAPADYQRLGAMLLRCSHIEHILSNCLKVMLRLSEEETALIILPLSLERRFQMIKKIAPLTSTLTPEAKSAIAALTGSLSYVQTARNHLAHSIMVDAENGDPHFENRLRNARIKKEDLLSEGVSDLINYAAMATLNLRLALGLKTGGGAPVPLPNRPATPACLDS